MSALRTTETRTLLGQETLQLSLFDEQNLAKIQAEVMGRTRKLMTAGEIGEKMDLILHRYKMRKHFSVLIADGQFTWSLPPGH